MTSTVGPAAEPPKGAAGAPGAKDAAAVSVASGFIDAETQAGVDKLMRKMTYSGYDMLTLEPKTILAGGTVVPAID